MMQSAPISEVRKASTFVKAHAPFSQLYGYSQDWQQYSRLGLFGLLSSSAVCDGILLPHEKILEHKVEAFARTININLVPPLMLIYRHCPAIDRLLAESRDMAECSMRPQSGEMKENLFPIKPQHQAMIMTLLGKQGNFLIADGHHRVSAMIRRHRETKKELKIRAVWISDRDAILGSFLKIYRFSAINDQNLLERFMSNFEFIDHRDHADCDCFSIRLGRLHYRFSLQARGAGVWRSFHGRLLSVLDGLDFQVTHYLPPDASAESVASALDSGCCSIRFPVMKTTDLWSCAERGEALEPHSTYFFAKPLVPGSSDEHAEAHCRYGSDDLDPYFRFEAKT